jgi:hypothetical protein
MIARRLQSGKRYPRNRRSVGIFQLQVWHQEHRTNGKTPRRGNRLPHHEPGTFALGGKHSRVSIGITATHILFNLPAGVFLLASCAMSPKLDGEQQAAIYARYLDALDTKIVASPPKPRNRATGQTSSALLKRNTMNNTTTHYQTSFKVDNSDAKAFFRLKQAVYGWILKKEKDRGLRIKNNDFFFRGQWPDLYLSHASLITDSYLNQEDGGAWAIHYSHKDRDHGCARFWHSDIGLKQTCGVVVVSVRISFAWNTEYLDNEPEPPSPYVPTVIRYILDGNNVFSGRPEFRLVEKPIRFSTVGEGQALCQFIQSPERRYPLIVFNGDSSEQVCEAESLAHDLTGKCQVIVIGENKELNEEIRHFLPQDYWIRPDQMRVYFPFSAKRNTPDRHRWYNVYHPDYQRQRQGMVNGLLRHNSLAEVGAVESVEDIRRLVSRDKLLKVKTTDPEQQKIFEDFLKEHAVVAEERDNAKREANSYANQVDELEKTIGEMKWKIEGLQKRLDEAGQSESVDTANLLEVLPETLFDVANAAQRFFPRLVITKRALRAAEEYPECKSISQTWEMLRYMNNVLYQIKFEDELKDLEGEFKSRTGYELAMSEGRNTKRDKKLMGLRLLDHNGKQYDITPHLKHLNEEPKAVRIYFDFDEATKKIIVGHIGKHITNATSKMM